MRKALDQWLQITEAATWDCLQDIRETFPMTDGVTVKMAGGIQVVATVFNVKGNSYRLIAVIDFGRATIRVVEVLTHAEYSKGRWKDRL